MKCVVKSVGAAFVIFAFGGSLSYAGVITDVQPGGNFDLTGVKPPPPNPNNDDAGGASNVIGATKVFKNNGPMDHVFTVQNSSGITEYRFSETVVNMTGVDWNDFHFQLGFGTGAAFQLSGPNDGLDFDTPNMMPPPTSGMKFAALAHGANALTWTTGLVKNGASVDFGFSIDVPDNADIPADFRVGNGYSFTLREQPSLVPEPGAVGLFGIGAFTVFGYIWRKRGAKSYPARTVATA